MGGVSDLEDKLEMDWAFSNNICYVNRVTQSFPTISALQYSLSTKFLMLCLFHEYYLCP